MKKGVAVVSAVTPDRGGRRRSETKRMGRRGEKSKVFGKGEGRRTGRRGRMKKEKEGVEYLYMYVCENYH